VPPFFAASETKQPCPYCSEVLVIPNIKPGAMTVCYLCSGLLIARKSAFILYLESPSLPELLALKESPKDWECICGIRKHLAAVRGE